MKRRQRRQKMGKYLSKYCYSGSILERANYSMPEKRTFKKLEGSLIELDMTDREERTIWQKIKTNFLKQHTM